MSQLYVAGNIAAWPSQTVQAGFLDSRYYVMLAGSMSENNTSTAIAVQYTGGTNGWVKTYPGVYTTLFKDMAQLNDGSYIATGTYFLSENAGDENMWLVNIDTDGNQTWDTQIGQTGIQTDGTAIVATSDGGFVATGTQIANNTISTIIVKYNADKTVAWQKAVENFAGFSIHNAAGNTFILSGRQTTTGLNSSPVAILMDANGNITLNQTFSDYSLYVLLTTDAIQTADGNFVLVAKNVVIKFNASGSILWSAETGNGSFSSVAEKTNGNLVIGGATIVSNTSQGYVVVTDSNCEHIIWDNSETLAPSSNASVFIDPRADGGVVWTTGTISTSVTGSTIVFAAYNPVTTLTGDSGVQRYALIDTRKEAIA